MNDLFLCNELSVPELKAVINGVVNHLSGSPLPKDMKNMGSVHWTNLVGAVKVFCEECNARDWTKEEMVEQLERLDVAEVKTFSDVITQRRSDIANALRSSSLSENRLTDFDWQLKLVMSSDKVSNIQEPVVAVNLALQNSHGQNRNRSIEMSKDDLQKLLSSIEAANKSLNQLTS